MSPRRFTHDAADQAGLSRRYACAVFVLLFALMVVDHVDRQIVVSMLPQLKAVWGLSDIQLGGLVSVVSLTVALGVVPLSLLADRWSRVRSIFLMALIWSLATVACAFCDSYVQLLGARGVVGLGEAAYGTAGAALIASLFPARVRSTMLGAFLAAAVVGSVLGVLLGGIIAERWGWQTAFSAAGVPGLILAFLFLLIARESDAATGTRNARRTEIVGGIVRQLLRPPTARFTCIGGGLQLLVVAAMYAWLPSYLNRYYGLPPDRAGINTALIVLVGGFAAVFWSIVADRLSLRWTCARLYVPAIASVMTTLVLCGAFVGTAPGELQLWLLATAVS